MSTPTPLGPELGMGAHNLLLSGTSLAFGCLLVGAGIGIAIARRAGASRRAVG